MNILVIHGPNLHLLGKREPGVYGALTLKALNALIKTHAAARGAKIRSFQSNCEGGIIDLLTANAAWANTLIINPGAYTHYSYAIRDAIKGLGLRAVEVHLSDIARREPFRKRSVIKAVCVKQIKGFGPASYTRAIDLLLANEKK
jgi:3-dehydroquinate dehydratase-2